jgi:hypothetical protein
LGAQIGVLLLIFKAQRQVQLRRDAVELIRCGDGSNGLTGVLVAARGVKELRRTVVSARQL